MALGKLPAPVLPSEAIFIVPRTNHALMLRRDAHLDRAGSGRLVSRKRDEVIVDTGQGGIPLDVGIKLLQRLTAPHDGRRIVRTELIDEHAIVGEQLRDLGPLPARDTVGIASGLSRVFERN